MGMAGGGALQCKPGACHAAQYMCTAGDDEWTNTKSAPTGLVQATSSNVSLAVPSLIVIRSGMGLGPQTVKTSHYHTSVAGRVGLGWVGSDARPCLQPIIQRHNYGSNFPIT